MRKILIIIMCLFCFACDNNYVTSEDGFKYKIIIIDECEYIQYRGYAAYHITHKGNCKYCIKKKR